MALESRHLLRFTPLYGLMLSRYRRGAGAWSVLDQSGYSSNFESKELLIRQLSCQGSEVNLASCTSILERIHFPAKRITQRSCNEVP